MQNQNKLRFIIIFVGAILFNLVFWNETIGLNILIFTLFLMGGIWITNQELIKKSLSLKITLAGMNLMAIMVVVYGSEFSFWIYCISFLAVCGFLISNDIKSLSSAIPSAMLNFVTVIKPFITEMPLKKGQKAKFRIFWRFLGIILIPIIIFIIFFVIFRIANPVFDKLSSGLLNSIGEFLYHAFREISFVRLVFFAMGLWLISGVFLNSNYNYFSKNEIHQHDVISRIRNKILPLISPAGKPLIITKKRLSLALKKENLAAIVLMASVNLLLLVVNVIDINWVWFGFSYSPNFDLKQFVHEGTYLLILSILLSIGIMIYFFRANLNFFSKNKTIKWLAYVWIVQNFILVISVAIRNLHYITYYGLAYKRIGVFFFLILVVLGLILLWIKIRKRKTFFYLVKTNLWAAYVLMVLVNFFDWDLIIARHNLAHPLSNNIETSFLLTLADKTLPLIAEKPQILEQSKEFNTYIDFYPYSYRQVFDNRVQEFINRNKNTTWLSWNYAESNAIQRLSNIK